MHCGSCISALWNRPAASGIELGENLNAAVRLVWDLHRADSVGRAQALRTLAPGRRLEKLP